MHETPPKPPDAISTEKSNNSAATIRTSSRSKVTRISSAGECPPPDYKGPVNTGGTGSDTGNLAAAAKDDDGGGEPPPAPRSRKAPPKMISGGVLNGKATSLPKPAYPAAARAVRASGPSAYRC